MYSGDVLEKKSLKRKAESQELHKEIEKRRRDRINQSLMELSQAIPAAFAKQTTRRLEKAEILEMTVHYIRAISNTEMGARFQQGDWYSSDIWADFIHHYQSGYSDCMRELHSFYRAVEGRTDQDEEMNRVFTFLKSRYRPESSVADGEAFRRQSARTTDFPTNTNSSSPPELISREPPRMINALSRNVANEIMSPPTSKLHQIEMLPSKHHQIEMSPGKHHQIEMSPGKHHQIEMSPGKHHQIEMSPGKHHQIEMSPGKHHQIEMSPGKHHQIEMSPGKYHQIEMSPGKHHQIEMSPGMHQIDYDSHQASPIRRVESEFRFWNAIPFSELSSYPFLTPFKRARRSLELPERPST